MMYIIECTGEEFSDQREAETKADAIARKCFAVVKVKSDKLEMYETHFKQHPGQVFGGTIGILRYGRKNPRPSWQK